ncbi:uncharacterized protein AAG666_001644 [Megaptera novaeangliae]
MLGAAPGPSAQPSPAPRGPRPAHPTLERRAWAMPADRLCAPGRASPDTQRPAAPELGGEAPFGPPGLRSRRGGARSSRMGRDGRGVRSSAPGARPGIPPRTPAAGGGEGRCAVRAVTRAAPAQPGGGGGGGAGTRCPGGPAPRPSAPGPPAARPAAAPRASVNAYTTPTPRPDVTRAPAALPPCSPRAGAAPNRPSLPYLGPFPFQLEEL